MKKTRLHTEVRKIRDMRDGLSLHQKFNGTQMILSEKNKEKIDQAVKLLSEAADILEQIN